MSGRTSVMGFGRGVSVRIGVALMAAGTLLGGCAGNKNDELARLNGERDALLEAIERDRAALASVPEEAPAPAVPDNTNTPGPAFRDDGDFGYGTTTRRDNADLIVEVAGDVLFDSGSIVLKATAKRTLDQVARRITSDYGANTIRVEGHTDSDPLNKTKGKYKDNEELSAQRALAVERYLVSRGVPGSQIYAAAFGPANPKGSKRASRRVEIVILNAR